MIVIFLRHTLWKQPSPYIIDSHSVDQIRTFMAIEIFNFEHAILPSRPLIDKMKKLLIWIHLFSLPYLYACQFIQLLSGYGGVL